MGVLGLVYLIGWVGGSSGAGLPDGVGGWGFWSCFYLMGWVGGSSVMAMSEAALYATREFSAASFRSLPVANSARYLDINKMTF